MAREPDAFKKRKIRNFLNAVLLRNVILGHCAGGLRQSFFAKKQILFSLYYGNIRFILGKKM